MMRNNKGLNEDVTQVSNVDGGRIDVFQIKKRNKDILNKLDSSLVESIDKFYNK